MHRERRADCRGRVARRPRVEAITFDAHMEHLVQNAVGVIAMGGYNTFCEILSLNKRAVIVPRKLPRMEQFIRDSRAQELGRSDDRRVGQEGVSTCRSRVSPYP